MIGHPDALAPEWCFAFRGTDPDALRAAAVEWSERLTRWAHENPTAAREAFPDGRPWPAPWSVAETLPAEHHRAAPTDPWGWYAPTGSTASPLWWAHLTAQERLRAAHPGCYVPIPDRTLENRTLREARWRSGWPAAPHRSRRDTEPLTCGLYCSGAGGPAVTLDEWAERWRSLQDVPRETAISAQERRGLFRRLGISPADLSAPG